MKYDYDVLTIGMGPAGMAVSAMAAQMGLKVCGIERRAIGGECMNVGCIPSKSLLKMAKTRHTVTKFPVMELANGHLPEVKRPFSRIRDYLKYINEAKTTGMFKKVDVHLGKGDAEFVDAHTVRVGGQQFSSRRIFICAGTKPALPPVPGLEGIDYLTNENVFDLDAVPASMTIIGGGAIGSEMAQAFTRLGCTCTIVHLDPFLVPHGDPEAAEILEQQFKDEGIAVYNGRKIMRVANEGGQVALYTHKDERIVSDRLLVGAGRAVDFSSLKLEYANVKHTNRCITVDKYLRTNRRHIYACGDCNGHFLLSHAAMHQGMVALMNATMPGPMKMDFRNFVVPWTVFTEPQISYVGMSEQQIRQKDLKYETIRINYEDYGAAIAEAVDIGFVKVFVSKRGRIFGVSIVGEGSGEMINEWAMAIQKKIRMHEVMLLQHSFPTMGFLSKRAAETWMMKRMESPMLGRMARFMYRV